MKNGKYAARRSSGTKVFALLLAVLALVGCSVGATLAWLVADTDPVTNTFTVGQITIDLKEHKLNNDGTLDKKTEVIENKDYKIVPGATQPKDPFVTVNKGSEKCYVYVKIENTMKIGNDVVVTPDIDTNNWEKIGTTDDVTLYRYKGTLAAEGVVDASAKNVELKVFENITYDGTKITKDNIEALAEDHKIELKAYAHQSDNVDQDTADAAAKTWAGIGTT